MRDRIPELEYVFCDTGEELPETYDYLEQIGNIS
jgi:3'-phosphoadenosine 5'-phosphosulfate sulfotransferase (PAPS reductase)/FAD synthetase